jgi:hypothetical protein
MKHTYIAVDFDGTCVTHEYPRVGRFIGAPAVLKKLSDHGYKLILFTMRDGQHLMDAVAWFAENNIPLHGVNHNPDQASWTKSPKAYAHHYIDDAAIGAPLVKGLGGGERDYIDWEKIKMYFPMIDWSN